MLAIPSVTLCPLHTMNKALSDELSRVSPDDNESAGPKKAVTVHFRDPKEKLSIWQSHPTIIME